MTKEEYDQQLRETSAAKQEARNIRNSAEQKIKEVQSEARKQIENMKNALKQRVSALESALASEQEESALQRGLNANLLRIARERANADRKLRPKKEHTGYVVVASMEKEHRYKDRSRRLCSVMLWETVLETPYVVDFEVEEVKRLIQELFQKSGGGGWLIQRVGINANYPGGYAKMIDDAEWREDHCQYNVMLERRLKANYRSGYWELIFLHTKPLASVPTDMRAG